MQCEWYDQAMAKAIDKIKTTINIDDSHQKICESIYELKGYIEKPDDQIEDHPWAKGYLLAIDNLETLDKDLIRKAQIKPRRSERKRKLPLRYGYRAESD